MSLIRLLTWAEHSPRIFHNQEKFMFKFKSRPTSAIVPTLFVLVSGFGCVALPSHAQMAPRKAEPDTFFTSMIHRRKAEARLRKLWQQRGQKKVAQLILPFAADSVSNVQYNALRMLGRLEDPIALPTLQKLAKRPMYMPPLDAEPSEGLIGTYPMLPLAIGRIKSRNLSGKRKIEVSIRELGLDYPALVRLSQRINRDGYGPFRVGYPVLQEVVDILYRQKKRGVSVDSITNGLSLRPAQRALLSAAALPPPQQSKKLLDYLANARIMGGDELQVVEYWEDLGAQGRAVALPIIKKVIQHPKRKVSVMNMVPVLESMARSGDKSALALLKGTSK